MIIMKRLIGFDIYFSRPISTHTDRVKDTQTYVPLTVFKYLSFCLSVCLFVCFSVCVFVCGQWICFILLPFCLFIIQFFFMKPMKKKRIEIIHRTHRVCRRLNQRQKNVFLHVLKVFACGVLIKTIYIAKVIVRFFKFFSLLFSFFLFECFFFFVLFLCVCWLFGQNMQLCSTNGFCVYLSLRCALYHLYIYLCKLSIYIYMSAFYISALFIWMWKRVKNKKRNERGEKKMKIKNERKKSTTTNNSNNNKHIWD